MLDNETKRKIDDARDILVGKVPVPSTQVEQITIALIYKFMDDMDMQAEELGGEALYFRGDYAQYAWNRLFAPGLSGEGRVILYQEALRKIPQNPDIPPMFRDVFKNAFLPYRDPETLKLFLKCINEFTYSHSENLGDAFEYLLAVLGSQGDAGQFRTPRHIIDFIVELVDPQKDDSILDPACGTAGFLISAYKHILKKNSSNYDADKDPHTFETHNVPLEEVVVNGKRYTGDLLTPDQREYLHEHIRGYDIASEMVRLSLVNMYLHGFVTPHIFEYDTLTSTERWNEISSVILANPPFMSPKGGIKPHKLFTIQSKRSEVLFVDYMLEHLTSGGKAGIIVPEGIIFQGGKAYKQLRKKLVEDNYLVGVVSLPAGVFNPYSGVKTSILWIDRALAKKTDSIIFLKVNADGFDLGATRRPIEANDLPEAFANAMAFKNEVISSTEYCEPDQGVVIVEKSKLSESGDYNLSGERYKFVGIISSDYPMVELGKVCKLYQPETISAKEMIDNGEFPVFGANGIIGRYNKFNHTEEEVVITCRGATCGTVNMTLLKSWITGNAMVAHPSTTELNKRFLYYLLNHSNLTSTISGSAQPQITRSSLSPYKIPLPPISVQEEIVAELDSYQKIIDGARQVVENWKPHIDICPKWERHTLLDICIEKPQYGSGASKVEFDGRTRYIRISDINEDGSLRKIDIVSPSVIDERYYLNKDDILFARSGSVGRTYLHDEIGSHIFAGYLIRFVIDSSIAVPRYVFYYTKSDEYYAWIKTQAKTGTISNINAKQYSNLSIPLPEIGIQQAIVDKIEEEKKVIDANRQLISIYEQKIKDRIDRLWKS